MDKTTKQIGDAAEKTVREYLIKNGYRIRNCNFSVHNIGELDIVCDRPGDYLSESEIEDVYIVEVRARKSSKFYPNPIETITEKKMKNLYRTAVIYCDRFNLSDRNICFLVASVTLDSSSMVQKVELIPFE